MWYHSGIRMVLHQKAPDALNPRLEIPDLAAEFPDARSWLTSHLSVTAFGPRFTGRFRPGVLTVIRRASSCLAHYSEARRSTLRYAAWDGKGDVPGGDFLRAIGEWENCLLQFYMLTVAFNKLLAQPGNTLFRRGDGSATERLYTMANAVKHAMNEAISADDLTPLWLTKTGLEALGGITLSYEELAEEVRDIGLFSRSLVDPSELAKARRWEDGPAKDSPL